MSESSSPKSSPATKRPAAGETGDKPTGDQQQRRHSAKKQAKGVRAWLTLLTLLVLAGIGAGGYLLWHSLLATRQQLSADNNTLRQQ